MRSEALARTCGSPPLSSGLSCAPRTGPGRRAEPAVGPAWTDCSAGARLWLDSLPVRTSFDDLPRWFLTGNQMNQFNS